ncbi:MAG: hypothetical protein JWM10_3469 [Myxococcaceae bacterium]|nr:hypothetical protein [Myxococcaceae bacterium]
MRFLFLASALALAACNNDGWNPLPDLDAGPVDAGSDVHSVDAPEDRPAPFDAPAADVGFDVGQGDAGTDRGSDVGPRDVGALDVGAVDAGPLDVGRVDSGVPADDGCTLGEAVSCSANNSAPMCCAAGRRCLNPGLGFGPHYCLSWVGGDCTDRYSCITIDDCQAGRCCHRVNVPCTDNAECCSGRCSGRICLR